MRFCRGAKVDRVSDSDDDVFRRAAGDLPAVPKLPGAVRNRMPDAGLEYDYPRTNSGPLCRAEESGYLDSTDVFCPFAPGDDYRCTAGCPTNRERACIDGP